MPHTPANLHKSVQLYRKLLSLIRTPKSESELIRIIVDTISEQYPNYRAAYSNVDANGTVTIHYSRQPSLMSSLTGIKLDISGAPELLRALLKQEKLLIKDVRTDERFDPRSAAFIAAIGGVAHLFVPFAEDDGQVSMISLVHSEPTQWPDVTLALLSEIAELVNLMVREARAQAKLQKSEIVFRQFADNVEVVFWLTNMETSEMLYVSPAYEKIWGRSMQSLYENPLSFLEAVYPEDQARVTKAVMLKGEVSYEQIYRIVKPDGEIRWVKDRGFVVKDESGVPRRVAGFAEDITELHEAQRQIEAFQAQVVSKAKFAALGEMASGIAHEINNPLAVIHGIAVQLQEVLSREGTSKESIPESLHSVEKMANRIAGIVKGLRTFSREASGDPMQLSDLTSILQETLALCEAKLKEAGVDVRFSAPAEKIPLHCRSSEVSQVIVNLVNNAFDALKGTPSPMISFRVVANQGFARLEVEDNGHGIPRGLQEKIFQPFFTTKEVGKGTGLGLSISKGIVESHGGRLFLDTTAKSTRFVLEFPSSKI